MMSAIPPRSLLHKNTPIENSRTAFARRPGDYHFATRISSAAVTTKKTQEVDNALTVSAIPPMFLSKLKQPKYRTSHRLRESRR